MERFFQASRVAVIGVSGRPGNLGQRIVRNMQENRNEAFVGLEHKVNERGFTLLKTAMGMGIAPVLNGQVLSPEAYQQLDEATRQDIEERQQKLQTEMAETMRSIRDLEKTTKRQLQEYDREIADYAVKHLIEELKEKYGHLEEIPEYLAAVQADIVDNVEGFKGEEDTGEGLPAAMRAGQRQALLKRYQINAIVDNSEQEGAPVIFEPNPTYGNLLGRIEHRAEFGALVTDFTMIKPGCLHKANGGYVVVEMRGLLANPFAWEALKRALKNCYIRTEEVSAQLQVVSTVTLEPEPIPLDVKVVLIGDPLTYYLLHEYDEDFTKLFKVQADFGTNFDRTPESCQSYAQFIAARCHQEGMLPFEPQAVGRVGCVMAGCCCGIETTAWPALVLPDTEGVWVSRYPTQFADILANLLIAATILVFERHAQRKGRLLQAWPFDGFLFLIYVWLYCLQRFFVEFWRDDWPVLFGPFTWTHLYCAIGFVLASVLFVVNMRRRMETTNLH